MKLRKSKKGFTVVELVIVIAVIAVLAAILIPTFISLDSRAKKASDQSLVRNLNTALAAQEGEADDTPNNTMHDAVLDLEKWGYKLSALVTKSGEDLVWSSEENKFYLEKDVKTPNQTYWKIADSYTTEATFSVYAADGFDRKQQQVLNLQVGFDAGYNTGITSVEYTGSNDVVIRTAHGETALTINSTQGTIKHYGSAGLVTIQATADHSYHLYGSAQQLKVSAATGKVVIENSGVVVDLTEAAGATITNSGTVFANTAGAEGVNTASSYSISSVEELKGLRDFVNAGIEFDVPVDIKADLDLSKESWLPMGTMENPFNGVINGNNHVIKGLTNGSLTSTKDAFMTHTTKSYGSAYGLIGIAGASEAGKNLVVKDLKFEDVNIKLQDFGNCVGTVLGYAMDAGHFKNGNVELTKVEITNVKVVSGLVYGNNNVGGLIGKSYSTQTYISDCSNAADVVAKFDSSASRAAGIMSYTCSSLLSITNNSNSGSVTAGVHVSGIVSVGYNGTLNFAITSNKNSGSIVLSGASYNSGAAYIASCSSSNWSSDKCLAGSSYNYGSGETVNTNSGTVTMLNGAEVTDTPVLIQLNFKSNSAEGNGTSASK